MYCHALPLSSGILTVTQGVAQEKAPFPNEKIFSRGGQRSFIKASFPVGFKVISVGVTRKTPRVMEETKPPPNLEHARPIVPLTYIVFATSLLSESLGQTNSTVESLHSSLYNGHCLLSPWTFPINLPITH